MDWNGERTRQALRRIAALLFLFAALAARAAGAPWPVRRPALWALRRAERVARAFVTGEAGGDVSGPQCALNGAAAEATRLALSFRALAAAIDAEATHAGDFARHRPQMHDRDMQSGRPGRVRRVPAPDTS